MSGLALTWGVLRTQLFNIVPVARRAVVDSMNDGMIVLDKRNRIVDINPAAQNMFGHLPTQIIGQSIEQIFQGEPTLLNRYQDAVEVHNQIDLGEGHERRRYDVYLSPLYNHQRQLEGRIIIIRDITEQMLAEEALRQTQKLESLGVLASGIAHDFNNLLVAILGQASVALKKLPPEESARTNIERAAKAAERAADLTRQLLAYSGQSQPEIHPLDLNTLIEENLHLFQVAVPKTICLSRDLDDSLPLIEADKSQIQQVIMNLITNAAEAIGNRPGKVIVTTNQEMMTTKLDGLCPYTGELLPPGQYVTLQVSDNGSGMNEATLAKIFDPFYTTKFTGRGLGLAAVLGIVRGHEGGVKVDSKPGQGTTFTFYFPASSLVKPHCQTTDNVRAAGSTQGYILIIDDEPPILEAVRDILELDGLHALTAADGRTGIELYRKMRDNIHLVLLDLSMPEMSGEETLTQLQEIDPDVPVLLSSGYSETVAVHRIRSLGVLGFLQKPYDADKLLNAVHRYLL